MGLETGVTAQSNKSEVIWVQDLGLRAGPSQDPMGKVFVTSVASSMMSSRTSISQTLLATRLLVVRNWLVGLNSPSGVQAHGGLYPKSSLVSVSQLSMIFCNVPSRQPLKKSA